MKDTTGQATSAFAAETKLLVYNDNYNDVNHDNGADDGDSKETSSV